MHDNEFKAILGTDLKAVKESIGGTETSKESMRQSTDQQFGVQKMDTIPSDSKSESLSKKKSDTNSDLAALLRPSIVSPPGPEIESS